MGAWRKANPLFGALALILVVAAVGCSSSTYTWPPSSKSSGPAVTPAASAVHVDVPGSAKPEPSASAAPRETSGSATVDNITAGFTYKSSLITPLAHLYGTFLDDFVVVTIDNGNTSPVKVVVSSVINGYTDTANDTVTVPANGNQEVRQNPMLTTAAIDGLNSEHQADLHVTISYLQAGEPKLVLDQTRQTLVTSRRDFPWSIKGFTQIDNYRLVVAMITPSDPSVEQLIRIAADYDPSGAMTSGYDSTNDYDGSVWQRLSDVWQAEASDYKLTYISTPITFAPGSSQRIRLPGEVLDGASGNCIELTLLYASVVEALDMQAALVIVPGHAYVAVRVDDTNDNYYFVETTMIGQATFDTALKYGLSEWTKDSTGVHNGDQDYGWIDVAKARADGITPIPWR
jgi:hypothetical protein